MTTAPGVTTSQPATPGAGYLRYPTIAGDTVVFVAEDDLWRVSADGGPARRLTSGGTAYAHPRLDPAGQRVAFVGADDGPTEVYVLPLTGGPPRRLTYQAARCLVVGWHPERDEIIYASMAEQPPGFGYRLFAVAATGGPTRLVDSGAGNAVAHGPDGGVLIGRGIAEPARRKRYRGGAAGEFWIDPTGDGTFTRLPLPGNVASPCWVADRIWFIGDHEGVGNVYSCRTDGTDLTRHTDHHDFYARNLATDGRRLVYHAGATLYLIDPATDEVRPIEVELDAARPGLARHFVPAADHLQCLALSPDGGHLALVTRGRAYSMEHWSGPVRRHGEAEGVRYRCLTWLADGRRLVAVRADERPDEHLVVLPAQGGPATLELSLAELGLVADLAAAPVGGRVALTTNRQQLWLIDLGDDDADDGDGDGPADDAEGAAGPPTPRLLDHSPYARIEDPTFSPDGRWLAYTYPDSLRTSAIKLAEVESGRTRPVTRPVVRDVRPAFDPAGRYLYFLGQRELTAEPDQIQFDFGFPFGLRPYLVTLRADTIAPFPTGVRLEGQTEPPDPETGPPTVEVDFAGIERRIVPLPVREGRYVSIVPTPEWVLLHAEPVTAPNPAKRDAPAVGCVTSVELLTGEVTEDLITGVDDVRATADGSAVLYLFRDSIRVLPGGELASADDNPDSIYAPPNRENRWIDLDRVRVPVHPAAEWRQMYREAWRLQRELFWHAGMAGLDWDGIYERYLPLLDRVATRAEFSDLLWELLGELATSHAYERGGDHRRIVEHSQGFLGVDWLPLADAEGWRVGHILHGDPWLPEATSPCNRPGVDLRPGDALVAIDGTAVGPAGPGELLVGQAGREVELTVVRPGEAPRRFGVRAIGDETRARYLDWVARNREYVRAASAGRLGYLHVPDMLGGGYADFIRGLLAEADREALVVDVRCNDGGYVSPLLLDRLTRRRRGAECGRWSAPAPYPIDPAPGPMALLINDQTGSDGEIFSHAFRELGLGPLIGNRTWGGTIAILPRHELVDGTVTTQPEFRYVLDGVGAGLENHGVEPDIVVEVPPGGAPGSDPQLDAAIDHLLTVLGPVDARIPAARPGPASAPTAPGSHR